MADAPAAIGADKVHRLPVRVYYEDTDAAGIVYHANYLRFAERGRTEMLRALGIDQTAMRRDLGLVFAVHALTARYHKPARLDDTLVVETRLQTLAGASVSVAQRVMRAGETLVALDIKVACIDQAGRPRRLPAVVRHGLDALDPEVTSRNV